MKTGLQDSAEIQTYQFQTALKSELVCVPFPDISLRDLCPKIKWKTSLDHFRFKKKLYIKRSNLVFQMGCSGYRQCRNPCVFVRISDTVWNLNCLTTEPLSIRRTLNAFGFQRSSVCSPDFRQLNCVEFSDDYWSQLPEIRTQVS